MKLDLINMSKVPTAESVGENDKVLIESGGEIKKTAASNIGGGGGGGAVLIDWDIETGALGATWNEIYNYMADGRMVYIMIDDEGDAGRSVALYFVAECVTFVDQGEDKYKVTIFVPNNNETLDGFAPSADGYPAVYD